jgi:hypothetical protein
MATTASHCDRGEEISKSRGLSPVGLSAPALVRHLINSYFFELTRRAGCEVAKNGRAVMSVDE